MKTFKLLALFAVLSSSLGLSARADEEAIRDAVAAYVAAFNEGDAKAVGAMWADNAVHTDRETGERMEGRDTIQADIASALKQQPDTRLIGQVDRVRMIRPEVARVEGQTTVSSPGEEPSTARFVAILVREDDKWLLDSVEEIPLAQLSTPYAALQELDWLVGCWVDESAEARVNTTVRWTEDRAFLLRSFTAQTPEGVAQRGTQVIGWDPRSQEIRSWTFNSDGSFGDAIWSKAGDDWLIKSSQTLADGQAASGTFVLTRVDDDTISLKLIGHEIEGEPQITKPAVTVVRANEGAEAIAIADVEDDEEKDEEEDEEEEEDDGDGDKEDDNEDEEGEDA